MTITEAVNSWTNDTIQALNDNYNRLGLRASGNWGEELESKTNVNDQKINIQILGSPYTSALTDGRKPNKKQDKDSIRAFVGWAGSTFIKEWVEQKGINANPFAVAYKIAREGIQVPNSHNTGTLLSDVITEDRIDSLLKSIGNIVSTQIKTDIKSLL